MALACWIAGGFFALMALGMLRDHLTMPCLPRTVAANLPALTVVIAARDEAARVDQTLTRLMAQQGLAMQVILVDDRSSDRTPEIAARFAETHGIEVVTVELLPDGWIGKCHALHLGAQRAQHPYLLFLDADVWLSEPDLLARTLSYAVTEGIEHVTLTPFQERATLPAQATMAIFSSMLAVQGGKANRDHPGATIGIGAFNLVQRTCYESFGGHERLRLSVVDDLLLGKLMVASGGRTRFLNAGRAVKIEFAETLRGLIRVFEKNMFAGMNYWTFVVLLGLVVTHGLWFLAATAPVWIGPAGWVAQGGLWLVALPAYVFLRNVGWNRWVALLTPWMIPLFGIVTLNSLVKTLRTGGVRWRETFYDLKTLRTAHKQLFAYARQIEAERAQHNVSRVVSPYEPKFDSIRGTSDIQGTWEHRHPWSAPGPAYGCDWNDMCLSAFATSPLILFDERGEFLWRQPHNRAEESLLTEAMRSDVVACYNVDGLDHLTRADVEAWRRDIRPQILAWAVGEVSAPAYAGSQEHERERRDALLRYYEQGLDDDLDALVRQLPR